MGVDRGLLLELAKEVGERQLATRARSSFSVVAIALAIATGLAVVTLALAGAFGPGPSIARTGRTSAIAAPVSGAIAVAVAGLRAGAGTRWGTALTAAGVAATGLARARPLGALLLPSSFRGSAFGTRSATRRAGVSRARGRLVPSTGLARTSAGVGARRMGRTR